jgi:hypothetical protein
LPAASAAKFAAAAARLAASAAAWTCASNVSARLRVASMTDGDTAGAEMHLKVQERAGAGERSRRGSVRPSCARRRRSVSTPEGDWV